MNKKKREKKEKERKNNEAITCLQSYGVQWERKSSSEKCRREREREKKKNLEKKESELFSFFSSSVF